VSSSKAEQQAALQRERQRPRLRAAGRCCHTVVPNPLTKHTPNPTRPPQGIESLFPIQTACLDFALGGFDVVGRARTGCGKTLAFVLPIVQSLLSAGGASKKAFGRKPLVVVLAPTRELAKQVRGHLLARDGLRSQRLLPLCNHETSKKTVRPATLLSPYRLIPPLKPTLLSHPTSTPPPSHQPPLHHYTPSPPPPPLTTTTPRHHHHPPSLPPPPSHRHAPTTPQVHADFENIGKAAGLSTLCIYGGTQYGPQESMLRRGVDVVVGTPGRCAVPPDDL
jgi:hypothetical protein